MEPHGTRIRPYEPRDRAAVRAISLSTAYGGGGDGICRRRALPRPDGPCLHGFRGRKRLGGRAGEETGGGLPRGGLRRAAVPSHPSSAGGSGGGGPLPRPRPALAGGALAPARRPARLPRRRPQGRISGRSGISRASARQPDPRVARPGRGGPADGAASSPRPAGGASPACGPWSTRPTVRPAASSSGRASSRSAASPRSSRHPRTATANGRSSMARISARICRPPNQEIPHEENTFHLRHPRLPGPLPDRLRHRHDRRHGSRAIRSPRPRRSSSATSSWSTPSIPRRRTSIRTRR